MSKKRSKLQAIKALVSSQKEAAELPKLPAPTERNHPRLQRHSTDEDKDRFASLYNVHNLLQPAFDPCHLYTIHDESDVVGTCARSYRDNCARPIDIDYVGPKDDKNKPEVQARKQKILDLLKLANGKQSFTTIRRRVWYDRVVTNNGYIEVLRSPKTGLPDAFFHVPCRYVRVTEMDDKPTLVYMKVPRDGGIDTIAYWDRFRRFARVFPDGTVTWFKQLGDPRILDRETGKYAERGRTADGSPIYALEKDSDFEYPNRATEIWWFRDAFGGSTYGVPIWVSAMTDVLGRRESGWVNYDTLDHGGLPAWLLLVVGKLSKGSKKYLQEWVERLRNPSAYNDPGVLEIEPNLMDLNAKGGQASVQFQSLRDMRSEEAMFRGYRDDTKANIGMVFRLPPIMYGVADGAAAANYAALEMAETQVFGPMRQEDDERINNELLKAEFGIFDWEIRTKGSPIGDKELMYKALGMVGRTGGGTINQLLQMQNEVFGTQWPEFVGPFYDKISCAEALAMVRQGLVTYDPVTFEVRILDPSQTAGAPPQGNAVKADVEATIQKLGPLADVVNLFKAMEEIETEVKGYQPPDVEETDFEQVV